MKKLSVLFSILLMIFISACEMGVEEISRASKLESIKVYAKNAEKLNYLIGDTFNSEGIVVIGHYSDNTERIEDPRLIEYEGFNSDEPVDNLKITAKLGDFEDYFYINIVNADINGIYVARYPTKTIYFIKEAANYEGLLVYAHYTNNDIKKLDLNECEISGFDTSEVRPSERITIKYREFSDDFYISVYNSQFSKIKVFTDSEKFHNTYTKGSKLNLDGLSVYAMEDDKPLFKIDSYQINIMDNDQNINYTELNGYNDIEHLEAGDYKIKIYVNECEAYCSFTILNAYLNGLALVEPENPGSRIYYRGEVFNLSDYVFVETVTGPNKDDKIPTEKIIPTENLICVQNGEPLTQNGINTIDVWLKYKDVITKQDTAAKYSFDICVSPSKLDHITAKWEQAPENNGYPLGFSPNAGKVYGNWIIKGYYSDKTIAPITIPSDFCTFKFMDLDLENDDMNTIRAEINEAEENFIYKQVEVSYCVLSSDNPEPQTFTFNDCKVKVCMPIITNIQIKKYPQLTIYQGETFNLDGLEMTLALSDGSFKELHYNGNETCFKLGKCTNKIGPNTVEFTVSVPDTDIKENFYINYIILKNDIEKLLIEKRDNENVYFRKGVSYDSSKEQILKLFNIEAQYENEERKEIIQDGNIKDTTLYNQLSFKIYQTSGRDNNSQCDNAEIEILYKGKRDILEILASGKYSNNFNKGKILLAPPVPVMAYMNINSNKNDFYNMIINNNTIYTIQFKDGTTKTFNGNNNLYEGFQYFGFIYKIITDQNKVSLSYEAIDPCYNEAELPKGTLKLKDFSMYNPSDNIVNLRLEPKEDYLGKLRFYKNKIEWDNSYNLKDYFTVTATYLTGVEQVLTSNDNFNINFEEFEEPNSPTKIIASYLGHKAEYNCNQNETTKKITFLNQFKIEIQSPGSNYNSDNTVFKITDEKNASHEIHGNNISWNEIDWKMDNKDCNSNLNSTIYANYTSNSEGKYIISIQGSIADIDGNYFEYTSGAITDFITGLSTETTEDNLIGVVQQYKSDPDYNWFKENNSWFTQNQINFNYFFAGVQPVTSDYTGEFELENLYFNSATTVLPIASEAQEKTLVYKSGNSSLQLSHKIKLYPAIPQTGETCRYDFEHNNIVFDNTGNKAIKLNYSGIVLFERFYNLYIKSNIQILDNSKALINTDENIDSKTQDRTSYNATYENAFYNQCSFIKININNVDQEIPITRVVTQTPDPNSNSNPDPNSNSDQDLNSNSDQDLNSNSNPIPNP